MYTRSDLSKQLQEVQAELESLAATIPLDDTPPVGLDMERYKKLREKRNELHELIQSMDSKG